MKKNLKLIILQLAEESFDEILFLPRILAQLPPNSTCYCMVNSISSSFAASIHGCKVSLLTENQDLNLQDFSTIVVNESIDALIILDLYKYYLTPWDLNFLPLWLDDFQAPILALDYFNLLEYRGGQVLLRPGVNPPYPEGGIPEPLPIFPYLFKPVPPVPLAALTGQPAERIFAWNAIQPQLKLNQQLQREQLRHSLQVQEAEQIITLIIDPLYFLKALDMALIGFYMVLIEVIIFYLRQFPQQAFQLLVVGFFPPREEKNSIPDINVKVHYISHLTEDNYLTLIAGSDLIITHTQRSPILLDAMVAEVPVMVMGNSIIQELKPDQSRQLMSFFQPHPVLYQLVELMLNLNQWTAYLPIFPFINYPAPYHELGFPEPGLKQEGLFYHLLDTFDDLTSLPLFKQVLQPTPYLKNYKQMVREALKNESTLYLSQILTRILASA